MIKSSIYRVNRVNQPAQIPLFQPDSIHQWMDFSRHSYDMKIKKKLLSNQISAESMIDKHIIHICG